MGKPGSRCTSTDKVYFRFFSNLYNLLTTRHRIISVNAPARLHMGFIDLSGALGRHFGSVGVALNEISTRVTVSPAEEHRIQGPSAARAEKCLHLLCRELQVSDQLFIQIDTAIPEHVGLGSGTQMALAIGMALSEYYGLGLTVRDIAALTYRGQRSGIGIGVFEQGGLVVDGGRGGQTSTPPMLSHMNIPHDWFFILVFDARGQGLHGQQEILAFSELPPFSQMEAQRLCYLLLMQALPAVAENDLPRFGDVISQLQQSVGEHFASAQGGVFTSQEVGEAMTWMKARGATGIGQTSWGPTGFCMISGLAQAQALVNQARITFAHFDQLDFMVASANNEGGSVTVR